MSHSKTGFQHCSKESLMELAGHLCKRALFEWNLLNKEEKRDLSAATEALRVCLDPSSCTLAAQDFHSAIQGSQNQLRITFAD